MGEILLKIRSVLDDVEEKLRTKDSFKIWLDEFRSLAYYVEAILDEFTTEIKRINLLHGLQPRSSKVRDLIPACFNSLLMSPISVMKQMTVRLVDIGIEKRNQGLILLTSLVNEVAIYGWENSKKEIVELLLKDDVRDDDGGISVFL